MEDTVSDDDDEALPGLKAGVEPAATGECWAAATGFESTERAMRCLLAADLTPSTTPTAPVDDCTQYATISKWCK